ncbi:Integrator complex subunit 10 like protein [Argiope bruennichi]|uniref:Integrator complex subunit 10 n=1 Tax=Argiope bruennichi TaxID=94029 RepID=A0A8T0F9J7_ARGBR|nr:Integrator complex subunit 10 like protein [Argiope bruennichi]
MQVIILPALILLSTSSLFSTVCCAPNHHHNNHNGKKTILDSFGLLFCIIAWSLWYIVVSKSAPPEVSNMLIPSFVTVVECWEMLHRHQHFLKEFQNLSKNIQLENWPIFQEFFINMLMYGRAHRDAIEHLSRVQGTTGDLSTKNKSSLQVASCYYFLGEFKHCLQILFDVVLSLPHSTTASPKSAIGRCPARFLYFMGYNNKEILQYTISMLLKLYKCKDNIDDTYKDIALGYMLVLMQYDMEHEYELLNRIIETIKKAKSFCFPKFFNYIINVDILEEISYLATPVGGGVNLEILFHSHGSWSSQHELLTVGVNQKGLRKKLKQAFVNQMARCYENIDNLFIEFIKEEDKYLLLPLSDSL